MIRTVNRFFRRIPPSILTLSSTGLVLIIGLIDHATGYEMAFSIFYLIPVGMTAWFGSRTAAFWTSALSALAWLVADFTAGHSYPSMIIPFWNATVRFSFFVVVVYLLTTLRRQLAREIENATTDQLTGIRNSRGFMSDARRLWSLAGRYGHVTGLAYLDLDDFKQINDLHGHAEGDAVLAVVGETLAGSFRRTDVVGRLGGDEFAVLLPETPHEAALTLAERVRTELLRAMREHGWPVTVSIGVAVFRPPHPALDQALREADELMYGAKRAGRNRVLVEERPGAVEPGLRAGSGEVVDADGPGN